MLIKKTEQALQDIRDGKMVILVDDEDRENEGDLVIAAEKVTPEAINFMAREGRGLICLSLTEERANYLNLPPMVKENTRTAMPNHVIKGTSLTSSALLPCRTGTK